MIEPHFSQNTCHGDRVSNIRLTAGTCLPLMRVPRNKVSLHEALNLLLWQVFLNQLIQAFKDVQVRSVSLINDDLQRWQSLPESLRLPALVAPDDHERRGSDW